MGWLLGWLVGWMAGWLVACLVGLEGQWLVVGKDGKPAVFKSDEDPTNAMPHADLETLEKIADSDAKTIMKEEDDEPMAHNNSRMMTPPDARKDMLKSGGGNLLRKLKAYIGGRYTMRQKKRQGRKTRRT